MFPNYEFIKTPKFDRTILHRVVLSWQSESAALSCFGLWYPPLTIPSFAFPAVWNSCALSFLSCFLLVGWMHFVLYIWDHVGEWDYSFSQPSTHFLLLSFHSHPWETAGSSNKLWDLGCYFGRSGFWLGAWPIFQEFRTNEGARVLLCDIGQINASILSSGEGSCLPQCGTAESVMCRVLRFF